MQKSYLSFVIFLVKYGIPKKWDFFMKVLVNKKEVKLEKPCSCEELAKMVNLTMPNQAVAVLINDNLSDINTIVKDKDSVTFLNFEDTEGKKVYWHTSTHILAQAVVRLWPEALPTIGPAIEMGFYHDFANLSINEEDFEKIEAEMKKIIKEDLKPIRIDLKNKSEAKEVFAKNPYTLELISEIPEGEKLSYYKQGEYIQFCRGPHLSNLNKVKSFKLLKVSGAYWRGDSKKEMLTRIYGISFPDKKLLADYVTLLEEAKKRDHKLLGQQLNLFSLKEEAVGMPFFHPAGIHIWNALLEYNRVLISEDNYQEIKTPILLTKALWERSGHWFHYRENMYTLEVEKGEYAIKPMNCPGCMLYYKSQIHSYRELPLRIAEIGHVHRHEASGALNGLFRVRSFHQDDAHVFMKEEDIKGIILEILKLAEKLYMTFGLSYRLELSTRPEKSKTIGTDKDWELATNGLKDALEEWGHSYTINEGEGAFYGPKIDIHIKDALGRHWQCGTIQLDMSLPQKFELEYVSQTGEHKRPVMIHRVIFGSVERFFGILIEHFAGKFPLWVSPYPIRIIPVADRHVEHANNVARKIKSAGFICEVDATNESVSKKIRNAQLLKVNYMLTVGDDEMNTDSVSLRTRDNVMHGKISLDHFIEEIQKEKKQKALISPFSTSAS
jgi:threonyl-tRNA synthetase